MESTQPEAIALHCWAVIAEATNDRLSPREKGALVRSIAIHCHVDPDGEARHYSRTTIDRWIRAWRKGGIAALAPTPRSDTGCGFWRFSYTHSG
jgi:putative transposase